MRFRYPIGTALAGVALVLTIGANPRPAHAACPAFPDVPWWNSDQGAAKKIVNRNYNGDWAPYIAKWEAYRKRMNAIHAKGGTAVVKSRSLRLKGETLANHLVQIDGRIKTIQCLAEESEGRALNDFATAAGGNDVIVESNEPSDRIFEVAAVSGAPMKARVTAKCQGDSPVFRITNLGEKWPKVGSVSIYRTDGKELISKRSIRLLEGQKLTFRIRKKGGVQNGNVGIYLNPGWIDRPFVFDAAISCD